MKKFICVILILILYSCDYDSHTGYEEDDFIAVGEPNTTISYLKYFYSNGSGPITFSRDYTIEGTVTANDKSGNFYRTFIIDDGTGAIEIKAGLYDLYSLFPVGRRVMVTVTGLTIGLYDGMYQLGLNPASGSSYETECMYSDLVMDRYIFRDSQMDIPQAEKLSISDLTDDDIGRLIKISGLTLDGGGEETWAYSSRETYNGLPEEKDIKARDIVGDSIYVYTSGYADFALDTTPSGSVAITGIIMKRGRTYRIKFRDTDDVEIF
ncbi:MAG: DUF5689 domain-containing protein [Rikenellaceae bacterium]|nr:DUF5689 domain-containing protein [Rikenellaceae bacterium]